ncbi:hypothetical protein FPSE5266_20128 [Fusarium pseudograminearum]|nr:hypothetical protein FPSE5266_20128 [Fusarium pseudograminearum]
MVYNLMRNDAHGGMGFFFMQTTLDSAALPPDRTSNCLYWLCAKSPVMTRALDLAWRYIRVENQQVLVYVDTPWIQCFMVSIFRMAGFKTITVRPDHKPEEKRPVIAGWNDPNSNDEIFVVNLSTMDGTTNIHERCCKVMFLNWMLSAKAMLQVIGRHTRANQTRPLTFHLIKVKNSYYDTIERISCTEWAAQLSAEIVLPEWMTDHLREICIFELIKTVLHQPFNRYTWVVEMDSQGYDMAYHSKDTARLGHMFSVVAKLLLGGDEDKDFWTANADVLVETCRSMMEPWESPVQIEEFLMRSRGDLHEAFFDYFKSTVQVVRETLETDPAMQARVEAVTKGVKRRASGDMFSEEFDLGSDVEDGDVAMEDY